MLKVNICLISDSLSGKTSRKISYYSKTQLKEFDSSLVKFRESFHKIISSLFTFKAEFLHCFCGLFCIVFKECLINNVCVSWTWMVLNSVLDEDAFSSSLMGKNKTTKTFYCWGILKAPPFFPRDLNPRTSNISPREGR